MPTEPPKHPRGAPRNKLVGGNGGFGCPTLAGACPVELPLLPVPVQAGSGGLQLTQLCVTDAHVALQQVVYLLDGPLLKC